MRRAPPLLGLLALLALLGAAAGSAIKPPTAVAIKLKDFMSGVRASKVAVSLLSGSVAARIEAMSRGKDMLDEALADVDHGLTHNNIVPEKLTTREAKRFGEAPRAWRYLIRFCGPNANSRSPPVVEKALRGVLVRAENIHKVLEEARAEGKGELKLRAIGAMRWERELLRSYRSRMQAYGPAVADPLGYWYSPHDMTVVGNARLLAGGLVYSTTGTAGGPDTVRLVSSALRFPEGSKLYLELARKFLFRLDTKFGRELTGAPAAAFLAGMTPAEQAVVTQSLKEPEKFIETPSGIGAKVRTMLADVASKTVPFRTTPIVAPVELLTATPLANSVPYRSPDTNIYFEDDVTGDTRPGLDGMLKAISVHLEGYKKQKSMVLAHEGDAKA